MCFRCCAGHPGEEWGDQRCAHGREQTHGGGGHRVRGLAELLHLRRDVPGGGGAEVRLPAQRVRLGPGQHARPHRLAAEHLQQPQGNDESTRHHAGRHPQLPPPVPAVHTVPRIEATQGRTC